jgi:hypothetical protein
MTKQSIFFDESEVNVTRKNYNFLKKLNLNKQIIQNNIYYLLRLIVKVSLI